MRAAACARGTAVGGVVIGFWLTLKRTTGRVVHSGTLGVSFVQSVAVCNKPALGPMGVGTTRRSLEGAVTTDTTDHSPAVNVRLTPVVRDALEQLAVRAGRTISQLTRYAVDAYLIRYGALLADEPRGGQNVVGPTVFTLAPPVVGAFPPTAANTNINARIDQAARLRMELLAVRSDRTLSQLVRYAIEEFLLLHGDQQFESETDGSDADEPALFPALPVTSGMPASVPTGGFGSNEKQVDL